MIEKLSKHVISYLVRSKVIEDTEDDREYYQYGVEITLSSMLGLALVFIIGIITSRILECVVFLVTFIPIRQFTGGYHADTYLKCNATLCGIFGMLLLVYSFTSKYITPFMTVIVSMLSIIIISVAAPVANANKPIPKDKRCSLKFFGAIITFVYAIAGILLSYFSIEIGLIIVYTLVIICILIIYSRISERRCKNEKDGISS